MKEAKTLSAKEFIKAIEEYYKTKSENQNGRFSSWEHCYKCFSAARKSNEPDEDYLCLHLAFYLASWGMYRGSSFLLKKDYKVHLPVVQEILKEKYDPLLGLNWDAKNLEVSWRLVEDLRQFMSEYYDKVRKKDKSAVQNKVSATLITKILMGTLGCVPAYDRYFVTGIREYNVASGTFGKESLRSLVRFYEENRETLNAAKKKLSIDGLYPQMKLLDMGFWQIGSKIKQLEGNKDE